MAASRQLPSADLPPSKIVDSIVEYGKKMKELKGKINRRKPPGITPANRKAYEESCAKWNSDAKKIYENATKEASQIGEEKESVKKQIEMAERRVQAGKAHVEMVKKSLAAADTGVRTTALFQMMKAL